MQISFRFVQWLKQGKNITIHFCLKVFKLLSVTDVVYVFVMLYVVKQDSETVSLKLVIIGTHLQNKTYEGYPDKCSSNVQFSRFMFI